MTSVEINSPSYKLKWEEMNSMENSYSKEKPHYPTSSLSPNLRQTQLNFSPNYQFIKLTEKQCHHHNDDFTSKTTVNQSTQHHSSTQTSITSHEPLSLSTVSSMIITSPNRIMKQTILTETGISPVGNVFKKPIRKKKAGTNKK
ncbi:unnamed protein product [Schistosoma turkestanicum]|nr:unnamed protein product [Schistosoma turkestanicum]